MHLVIPMAGDGKRFSSAGYSEPKPLLPILGYRMYELVLANLMSEVVASVSIISRESFGLKSDKSFIESSLGVPVYIYEVNETTQGPAESAAIALDNLPADSPILIANSDQYLVFDSGAWLQAALEAGVDGSILCMQDSDPKWSYLSYGEDDWVNSVVEKQVVSNLATCGVYFFRRAGDFKDALSQMRKDSDLVNGEYYVGPAYNKLIQKQLSISYFDLGPVSSVMFGLGVPQDYEYFLASPVLEVALGQAEAFWGRRS